MHSFEVHSNESACRKKVRLGLEQVYGPAVLPLHMSHKQTKNNVYTKPLGITHIDYPYRIFERTLQFPPIRWKHSKICSGIINKFLGRSTYGFQRDQWISSQKKSMVCIIISPSPYLLTPFPYLPSAPWLHQH